MKALGVGLAPWLARHRGGPLRVGRADDGPRPSTQGLHHRLLGREPPRRTR